MVKHIEKFLSEFVKKIHEGLREDLFSVIVYGSYVSGDFKDELSDIDILVVLKVSKLDKEKILKIREVFSKLKINYSDLPIELEVYMSYELLPNFWISWKALIF